MRLAPHGVEDHLEVAVERRRLAHPACPLRRASSSRADREGGLERQRYRPSVGSRAAGRRASSAPLPDRDSPALPGRLEHAAEQHRSAILARSQVVCGEFGSCCVHARSCVPRRRRTPPFSCRRSSSALGYRFSDHGRRSSSCRSTRAVLLAVRLPVRFGDRVGFRCCRFGLQRIALAKFCAMKAVSIAPSITVCADVDALSPCPRAMLCASARSVLSASEGAEARRRRCRLGRRAGEDDRAALPRQHRSAGLAPTRKPASAAISQTLR